MKSFALLVLATYCCQCSLAAVEKNFSELATKLQYGESCSFETEKLRQDFTKTMLGEMELSEKIAAAKTFQEQIEKSGEPLCSAVQLFVCSKETRTCVCGDPGRSVTLGNEKSSKGFTIETGEDGTKKCRWEEKAGCAPENYFKTMADKNGIKLDSKCKEGTFCNAKDGSPCTMQDILSYAIKNRRTTAAALSKDMFEGKICSCTRTIAIELQDEEDSGDHSKYEYTRVKRFAAPTMPINDFSVAGGIIAPLI